MNGCGGLSCGGLSHSSQALAVSPPNGMCECISFTSRLKGTLPACDTEWHFCYCSILAMADVIGNRELVCSVNGKGTA